MVKVHILTQYIWPDAAPTGLYAEHVAQRLHANGHDVRLVGGQGSYRTLAREKPPVPILHLEHFQGKRGDLFETLREYASVKRVFAQYIENFVRQDDVVIVTSAPPDTVRLARRIKRQGAHAIYWLQDYYPELVRGIYEYPAALRRQFSRYWDRQLSRWDRVVKIGRNLAGPEHNAVVIRNWPTFDFEETGQFEPGTALYSGNLGYGHDVDLFVRSCGRLRDEGFRLTIRADGRGARQLPSWMRAETLHSDPDKLKQDLLAHEVHLVAAHPRITRAIFPSKIWNSIAIGRRLICSGFAGEMAEELEHAKQAPFQTHLDQWIELIGEVQFGVARTHAALTSAATTEKDLEPVPAI